VSVDQQFFRTRQLRVKVFEKAPKKATAVLGTALLKMEILATTLIR